jgi:hypothetical protein
MIYDFGLKHIQVAYFWDMRHCWQFAAMENISVRSCNCAYSVFCSMVDFVKSVLNDCHANWQQVFRAFLFSSVTEMGKPAENRRESIILMVRYLNISKKTVRHILINSLF